LFFTQAKSLFAECTKDCTRQTINFRFQKMIRDVLFAL
jgi:hypothetical protein